MGDRKPNPEDWCTWAHVERELGVTRQTVVRMVADGRLTQHRMAGGHPMFWLPEVREFAAARERAGAIRRVRAEVPDAAL